MICRNCNKTFIDDEDYFDLVIGHERIGDDGIPEIHSSARIGQYCVECIRKTEFGDQAKALLEQDLRDEAGLDAAEN